MDAEYITPAETARLIRGKLRRAFPNVPASAFRVRTHVYSMGSAVHVDYDGAIGHAPMAGCYCLGMAPEVDSSYAPNQCRRCGYVGRLEHTYRDGYPTWEQVRDAVLPYGSAGFDGMIDYEYSVDAIHLDASGDVIATRSRGSQETRGTVPAWDGTDTYRAATQTARVIRGGAKYIQVQLTGP